MFGDSSYIITLNYNINDSTGECIIEEIENIPLSDEYYGMGITYNKELGKVY